MNTQSDQIVEELIELQQISNHIQQLYMENNIAEHMLVSFRNITQTGNGYDIELLNPNSNQTQTIHTTSSLLPDYQTRLNGHLDYLREHAIYDSNGELLSLIDDYSTGSTMFTGFLIQTLMDYFSGDDLDSSASDAIKVEVYAGLIQSGVDAAQEQFDIVDLIAKAMDYDYSILSTISTGLTIASSLLNGINLAASVVEYIQSSDQNDREIIAAEIGLNTIGTAYYAAALIASFTEFEALAGVLNVLAVPVAGILAGLPTLINNFLVLKQDNTAIQNYFGHVGLIGSQGAFTLNNGVLIPQDDMVVTELNLNNNPSVTYGDFSIYPFTGGSGHTVIFGHDSFFSAPYMDEHATPINMYTPQGFSNSIPTGNTIMLPNGAARTFSYEMYPIAGITTAGETDGSRFLDKVRNYYGDKFTWRFIAGSEYSMAKLYPHYKATTVKVNLDSSNRTLMVPTITTDEIRTKMTYRLNGSGGTYTVMLPRSAVNLQFNGSQSIWVINADNQIKESTITDNKIVYGNNFVENAFNGFSFSTTSLKLRGQTISFSGSNKAVYIAIPLDANVSIMLELNTDNKPIKATLHGSTNNIISSRAQLYSKLNRLGLVSKLNDEVACIDSGNGNLLGYYFISKQNLIYVEKPSGYNTKIGYHDNMNNWDKTISNNLNVIPDVKGNFIIMGLFHDSNREIQKYSVAFAANGVCSLTGLELGPIATTEIVKQLINASGSTAPVINLLSSNNVLTTLGITSIEIAAYTKITGKTQDEAILNYTYMKDPHQSNQYKFILSSGSWSNGVYECVLSRDTTGKGYMYMKLRPEGTVPFAGLLFTDNGNTDVYVLPNNIGHVNITSDLKYYPSSVTGTVGGSTLSELNSPTANFIDAFFTFYIKKNVTPSNQVDAFLQGLNVKTSSGVSYPLFNFVHFLLLNTSTIANSLYASVPEANRSGWRQVNGSWYYFYQDTKLALINGYYTIEGEHYYFDSTGKTVAGILPTRDGLKYFASASAGSNYRYGQETNYTNWLIIGNERFYFDTNHSALTGYHTIDGKGYYFGVYGQALCGVYATPDGYKYFAPANTNGNNIQGQEINYTGWLDWDGNRYYFEANNKAVTGGYKEIAGKVFYFDTAGKALIGIYPSNDGLRYFAPANTSENNLYGQAINYTGWLDFGGNRYYFDSNHKATAGGHHIIDNQGYYFDSTGKVLVGVYPTQNGLEYFALANSNASKTNPYGAAIFYNGWLDFEGNRYYFEANSKALANGYHVIDGHHYYMDTDGKVLLGVYSTPNGLELFAPANTSGFNPYGAAIAYMGWLDFGGATYYFATNSKAVTGQQTIDGKNYTFSDKGILIE